MMEQILLLQNEIEECKRMLNIHLKNNEMILDREVIDDETFETIRPATEFELEMFYKIRLNELKIKEIKKNAK